VALSPGVKWPGREADHSFPTSAEVKYTCIIHIHFAIRLHGVALNSLPFYLSIGIQPFVGPLSLFFSFLILYTVGRIAWTGGQTVARSLPTQDNTNRINADWDSNS
jgi:hypothetical protein